ncbi:hypothetical protein GOP47_0007248 [Adiantum capillus-veneris]|uniref:Ubiquitin-like domain-containing protein n=1 Tax=Adiantum capillus-veneris TaxID=13818 RepID=A0A9D4ZJ47_ADICA|nr:hypothetical protein GOP47_0007248 [Adiantum capillus-veneris]
MLQPTALKPEKATSSLSVAVHPDIFSASLPPRMSVSRFNINVSAIPTRGLPERDGYIRDCLVATELEKPQSGMSVTTGAHFKRSYINEEVNIGDTAEYVEWGEPTSRGSKRREVSLEGESRSDQYTALFGDHHHHLQSGGSDLTTEQSAVCMAADESNSTRSTSSLNEDGYLLKIHSAIPPVSRYGDLFVDTDEDDHSSSLIRPEAAVSGDYHLHSVHAACSNYTHFPSPSKEGHWLASASCAAHDHVQHDLHDDTEGHDVDEAEAEADWLELRLGRNVACRDGVAHMSRSISPCTLQLLPEKPDCAIMKEREKQSELMLCCGEHYAGKTSTTTTFEARTPLMTHQIHANQSGTVRENHQHFYTDTMQASGLPMQATAADCTVGQYISRGGLLPTQHKYTTTVDRSCNPRMSTVDHPSSHVQQLLQDTGFHLQHDIEGTVQSRDIASLHGLPEGPSAFKSMVCSSLQAEGFSGSPIQRTRSAPPLPDFLHQNWDVLASSTSSPAPSSSMLQVATAPTCFRDLIASSFVKEPSLSKLEYGRAPLMTLKPRLQYNGDTTLGQHMIWHCNRGQRSQSSLNINHSSDLAIAANEGVNTSNGNMECGMKSMSEWLSQALSSTTFNSLNQGVLDQHEDRTDQFDANYISKSKYRSSSLKLSKGRRGMALRGSSGFWFALQPSCQEPESSCSREGAREDFMDVQPKTSYIRLKNGNVPLSVVKKFLIAKLGLPQNSQVELACRGKLLDECSYLNKIQDDIWIQPNWAHINELLKKSMDSSKNIPKDNVMILTYQILK